jgi:hypothetical protein
VSAGRSECSFWLLSDFGVSRERSGVGLGECEYLGAAVIKVGKGILLLRILH